MSKISIILHIEDEKNIGECINGLLNQSFEDIEIICFKSEANNGLLNQFAQDDLRIKLIDFDSINMGEQFNYAIENIESDYLMFLDKNALLLEDACSILYEKIQGNDFISFNENYLNLFDEDLDEIRIESIDENPELISIRPILSAQLFKKEFLCDNDLDFSLEYDEGLEFLLKCFLKGKGMKFIKAKLFEENSNIESMNKKKLLDYIKVYKRLAVLLMGTDYFKHFIYQINHWVKLFIFSDLDINGKIDLLRIARPMFDYIKRYDQEDIVLKEFITAVYKKDFLNSILIAEQTKIDLLDDFSDLNDGLDNKTVIMVSTDWSVESGGLPKAVCDRANLFDNKGYTVKILTIDDIKDFELINKTFHKLGFLNDSLNIINIFDYYSLKNTFNHDPSHYKNAIEKLKVEQKYFIKKSTNSPNVTILQYYESPNEKECNAKNLIKEDYYMHSYLALRKTFNKGKPEYDYYYTCDGFNYFFHDYVNKKCTLFDRVNENYIDFDNIEEFRDYFVSEFCLKSSEKPFLINDSSWNKPSIKDISPNIAYKFGVVHGNPYKPPFCFGSGLNPIASLNDFKNMDGVVLLTNSSKIDCIRQFGVNKFFVIPNFIDENLFDLTKKSYGKDEDVVSVFSRIAHQKNLADLIKAFHLVLDEKEDAVLKIFGRVESLDEIKEKRKLDKLINKFGMGDSVEFMGHVNNVFEEMNKSLATIFVSHFEGLPLSILESMICSTPVISYDTNYGPRDVIINGENGIVVDQYDYEAMAEAILELLNNPSKAHEMGRSARQHIKENFSSELIFKQWEDLFNRTYYKDRIKQNFYNKVF